MLCTRDGAGFGTRTILSLFNYSLCAVPSEKLSQQTSGGGGGAEVLTSHNLETKAVVSCPSPTADTFS